MLRMSIAFLVVALIAAFFGFGLVAGMAYDIAKLLFVVFLVLAVIAFASSAFRGRAPV